MEVQAVQYDGTADMRRELVWEYQELEWDGLDLVFTGNYVREFVSQYDWILVKNHHAIEVLSDEEFYNYYQIKK